MVEQELTPQPEFAAQKKRRSLWIPVVAAALVTFTGVGAYLWLLNDRVDNLQRSLGATERRAMSAEQEALQTARELTSTQSRLITAQQRALQAEQQAHQLDTAKQQSESQLRDSESQLDALRQESQAELEQLRERSESAAAAAEKAAAEKKQALAAKQQADTAKQQAVAELEGIQQRRAEELDRMQQALNHVAPTERTATGMVMQLANDSFNFGFDSAELKPSNRELLSRVAGVLLASEGYRLFIDGHTDDIGSDDYNKGLSERRAKSVRDYLVKAGVPADIISTNGFGKSNPLVKGKTREAREKNRRVEIGIVDTIVKYDTTVAAKKP